MMKPVLVLATLLLCLYVPANAQVKISTVNSNPDPSAMLDIESSSKGLLVPRMNTAQMNAISSPATGLLLFNLSDTSFYMYNGNTWTKIPTGFSPWGTTGNNVYNANTGNIGIGTNNPTSKLHLNGDLKLDGNINLPNSTPTTGVIYKEGLPFLHNAGLVAQQNVYLGTNAGTFNTAAKKNVAVGSEALASSDGADNTAVGYRAGYSLVGGSSYTASYKNTFIGYLSGENATGGINNVCVGAQAGNNLQDGSNGNTLIGPGAGFYVTTGYGNCLVGVNTGTTTGIYNSGIGGNGGMALTTGSYNSWLGANALQSNKTGTYNTVIGSAAGNADTTGYYNVYVGAYSGFNTNGYGNLFLGTFAGVSDTGTIVNSLIINNSFGLTHLINGDFNGKKVGINKTLAALSYTLDIGGEIRIGSPTFTPAGANGVIYYNLSENKLKAFENGEWKNAIFDNRLKTKAGDPNTTDQPNSTFDVWKNTSTGNVYLWVNDGGVMKKVQLQ